MSAPLDSNNLSTISDEVDLFTDGACLGNPGPGGWAALLRFKDEEKTLSGGEANTTNNRMELQAVIEGLRALTRTCNVNVYTDSQYVQRGITEWIISWKARNWRTSSKKPVKNADLWREIDDAQQGHSVRYHWVKGHAGHPENELVDSLARSEAEKILIV